MLFNSIDFLVFFPIVTILYFLLPHKIRWFHLLVASCIFYMAFVPIYILILFFTIIIDYVAGIAIENASGARRRGFLIMSILANVGVLAVFKYYNFFAENINYLFHVSHSAANIPFLKMILPIGLSFHTFQAMSYTIEVYRGNQKAERHFGIYSLYVMFYPQLVAGPIERPQNLLHQFHEKHTFDYENAVRGLRQVMWGMIKKVVIADRLATVVDPVFNHPSSYSGTTLSIAAIFFAFQIFCDFSGYSDIAIGTARVMGFKLMTNFNKPYHAKSVDEFWKRWHISLSTWFKDYLYISLGGNRVSIPRRYFNLFFVFLVSGLWHGANWTFLIWGGLNGFYLVFAIITGEQRNKITKLLGISRIPALNNALEVITTFTLITFSWVFFRANNVNDAFLIINKILHVPQELVMVLHTRKVFFLHLPAIYLLRNCFVLIASLELCYYISKKFDLQHTFGSRPAIFRWALYYAGPLVIYYFGVFEKHDFIYFQF